MHKPAAIFSDTKVISRILDGDVNAFELLMKRHAQTVTNIAKKHVPHDQVEEVAHEVFIRAFKSLKSLKNRQKFEHWVSSIAAKTCCDFWRKRYRSKEISFSALSREHQNWLETVLSDKSSQSFDEQRHQKKARKVLDWALGRLPAKDRMAIELVYLEGLSGKEAAKLLGWSTANVKVRCFRARRKLEKILIKEKS